MTLPLSGLISFQDINLELQNLDNAPMSFDDPGLRLMAQIPTGYISLDDLHGKSSTYQATGGSIQTYDEGGFTYKSHTFTTSGNFTVSNEDVTFPLIEYLIVGGGGGGGWGGGGAGRALLGTLASVSASIYAITVGNGGAVNANGSASSFYGNIAEGGGHGGTLHTAGSAGGSGGGAGGSSYADGDTSNNATAKAGGTGIASYGNAGGSVAAITSSYRVGSGGGGGAGAVGVSVTSTTDGARRVGRAGGAGLSCQYETGVSKFYAGGGGGGGTGGTGGDVGGSGVGGNGGGDGIAAGSPTPSTGSGGGGSSSSPTAGSAGVVIIRYRIA